MHIRYVGSFALGSLMLLGLTLSAKAQTSPVFQYSFPSSWNGTGTAVTDQSAAGNNGTTVSSPALSPLIPPGASVSSESVKTDSGAILTTGNDLLDNSIVAAAGGYSYDVSFMWDGTSTTSFGSTQKIIDYAGTESLQLVTGTGSAALQMSFDSSTVAVSTTILPNIWYHALAVFNSDGNSVDGSGNLAGTATLTLTDLTDALAPTTLSAAATKTAQGDGLNRPIGVGQLGANFGYLVGFKGEIYNPTVDLGVLPEPASLSLIGLLAPTLLGRRSRRA